MIRCEEFLEDTLRAWVADRHAMHVVFATPHRLARTDECGGAYAMASVYERLQELWPHRAPAADASRRTVSTS
ncbi:hypothetical protein HY632_03105 [Candidatus Uhrbacteria bacterium]|nr:hypothetical protein [Candidatus Uhrbacteria bacterium]